MTLRRLSILVAILVVGIPVTFLAATGRLWWRSGRYSVTVDNEPKRVPVYAGNGVILVDLRAAGDESYLIYPNHQELGRAQENNFIHSRFCVVSRQMPAIYIPIAKIIESQPQQEFGHDSVKFMSAQRKVVVVHW